MSMLKRTIEVSGWGYRLSGQGKQLRLIKNESTVGSVPFEDLGVLMLDSTGASITTSALVQTAEQGGITVVCGGDHLPVAMVQPLSGHSLSTERLIAQATLARPIRSALWANIVRSKIAGQAAALGSESRSRNRLLKLAKEVQPADKDHSEAQAARIYWKEFFVEEIDNFRRNRDESGANALLNYGYSAIRAAMARSLCAAGLQPALGLQHHNRSNPFCLADDFIEPFRPLVDVAVKQLLSKGQTELKTDTKKALLSVLTRPVQIGSETGPASVAMQKVAHSYAEILMAEDRARLSKKTKARPAAAVRAKRLLLPWSK